MTGVGAIQCDGTVSSSPAGFGTGTESNFTITVTPGSTVTGTHYGMFVGSSNTLNNRGTIQGTNPDIGVGYAHNANNLITNYGSIFGSTEGISGNGATIVNHGTISSGAGTVGLLPAAIYEATSAFITNYGTISGGSAAGVGIWASGAAGTLTNAGTISGGTGVNFWGDIVNSGTITGSGGAAVVQSGGSFTITGTSIINGTVKSSSGGALQLGGTTNATFDLALIGTQFLGYTSFNKIGGSSWTLTGNGAQNWTISNGTLVVDTRSLQGSQVTNNNILQFAQDFNGTYAGTISGVGAVVKSGSGTVVLTGSNTYDNVSVFGPGSIATEILAGTLQLGSGGATGSIAGNVFNASTFAIDRSDTYNFAGVISGSGSFSQIGTGTTILSGANTYGGGTTIAAGTLQATNGNSVGSGTVTIAGGAFQAGADGLNFGNGFALDRGATNIIDTQANTLTLSGVIADGNGPGAFTKVGSGTLLLTGANTYSGGTTISSGIVQVTNAGSVGTGPVTLAGGTFQAGADGLSFANAFALNAGVSNTIDTQANTLTLSGAIADGNGPGSLRKAGSGTLILTGNNSYTGPTTIAGTLQLGNGGTTGSLAGAIVDNGILSVNRSNTLALPGVISGTGAVQLTGVGTTILNGANSYSGGTRVTAGTLQVTNSAPGVSSSIGSGTLTLAGGTFQAGANGLTFANRVALNTGVANVIDTQANTLTFSGGIADGNGSGTLTKAGAGILVLTGVNTYTGATTVNSGVLDVAGTLASTTTGNANGTLAGTGTTGAATINAGGTLMPGASGAPGALTVAGQLAFLPGSRYVVQASPALASTVTVTGTAALAGGVQAVFAPGASVRKTYNILHATSLGGTSFTGAVSNLPGLDVALTYTGTDVFLDVTAAIGAGSPSTINRRNVAAAINGAINNGGTPPPSFGTLFALSGTNLGNALDQLSGEAATGAQQSSHQLMNGFLVGMTDGATFGIGADSSPLPFASEQARALPPEVATAYASMLAPAPVTAAPGWTVWGSAYGGAGHLSGDAAIVGSHDVSARAGGFGAGADRLVTPDTRIGFAVAGGFTNWSLANGLGGGHGDAFQAGLYGRTTRGPAYLAGALAFAQHWISTDRFAMGDHLAADFPATSFGGRLEGGYRLPISLVGVIPYGAIQGQRFHTPSFGEADLTGGGFGLTFKSQASTYTRAEVGSRFERLVPLDQDAMLALRARLAWAHDWVSNPAVVASFLALPGASFVVYGASPRPDSGLVTFGPEVSWRNGWSLMAKFEGEFASGAQTYAGTARLRYAW